MTAPPAARAAMLRRLPGDGFVPPAAAVPWSPAARAAAFAADVEAFAAAYWALVPKARRDRYNALWESRYGPAAARLAELEWGRSAASRAGAVVKSRTVSELARELYRLRLRARAAECEERRAGTVRVGGSESGDGFPVVAWSADVVPVPPYEPVPEWAPQPDPDAVPRGVAAFHTALADHAAAEGRERRVGRRAWGIITGSIMILVAGVSLKEGCHPRDRRGHVPMYRPRIESDFRVTTPPEETWPWVPNTLPTSRAWRVR
ncbi:hypothetical protein J0H58_34770 [bacterium]|nr:hypothetical protein [bacterium]